MNIQLSFSFKMNRVQRAIFLAVNFPLVTMGKPVWLPGFLYRLDIGTIPK